MSDQLDMHSDINSYSPETVGAMDHAFEAACRQAAARVHLGEDIRQMLATSILEGTRLGIRRPEDLVAFSLRSLPAFRNIEARAGL